MWESLLKSVLTMSLYGSLMGLAVLVLSLLSRHIRAPKSVLLALWALVALRLLCPVNLTSVFSVFNAAPEPSTQLGSSYVGSYQTAVQGTPEFQQAEAAGAPVQTVTTSSGAQQKTAYYYKTETGSITPAKTVRQWLAPVLVIVWMVGVGAFGLRGAASYVLLRRKLRFAMRLEGNVYEVDTVPSPCVVGIFRPRIYLPVGLSEIQQRHTIAHEKSHIRHGDPIWKVLSYLALAIHWFNPLVWLQYHRFQQDLEMACDERVLKGLDAQARADYSESLLALAKRQHTVVPTPIAFSENTTKERITKILRNKKPLAIVTVLVLVAGLVAAVTLATGSVKSPSEPDAPEPSAVSVEPSTPVEAAQTEPTQSAGSSPEVTPALADIPSELFSAHNVMAVSIYVADADVYGGTYTITQSYHANGVKSNLESLLHDYEVEVVETPTQEPAGSWLRFADPEGDQVLIYYFNGTAGLFLWNDGTMQICWKPTTLEAAHAYWTSLRNEYDKLELSYRNVSLSAPDAQTAVETFAQSAYGDHLRNLTPGNHASITGYQAIVWDVVEISTDGCAVLGTMEFAVTTEDPNSEWIALSDVIEDEGEYAGRGFIWRYFCLQLEEDGLWHCIGLDTGTESMPWYTTTVQSGTEDYVSCLKSEAFDYYDELGSYYNISISIPELTFGSADAQAVNAEIQANCLPKLNDAITARDTGTDTHLLGIAYHTWRNGEWLTLVIETRYMTDFSEYAVYSFDVTTGRLLTNDDFAALRGIDRATLDSDISAVMYAKYLYKYGHLLDQDSFAQEAQAQLEKTCSPENIADAQVYLDKLGQLRVLCRIYSMAGASYYEHSLSLELAIE